MALNNPFTPTQSSLFGGNSVLPPNAAGQMNPDELKKIIEEELRGSIAPKGSATASPVSNWMGAAGEILQDFNNRRDRQGILQRAFTQQQQNAKTKGETDFPRDDDGGASPSPATGGGGGGGGSTGGGASPSAAGPNGTGATVSATADTMSPPNQTMNFARSLDFTTRAETGKSPIKAMASISPDAGGSLSYGNLGHNDKKGSLGQFVAQSKLPWGNADPMNQSTFPAVWQKMATDPATSPQMAKEIGQWYYDHNYAPQTSKMIAAGINPDIANHPSVVGAMADRATQYGAKGINGAYKVLSQAQTPQQAVQSLGKLDLANVDNDFPTYLKGHPNGRQGLLNRINNRTNFAMGLTPDQGTPQFQAPMPQGRPASAPQLPPTTPTASSPPTAATTAQQVFSDVVPEVTPGQRTASLTPPGAGVPPTNTASPPSQPPGSFADRWGGLGGGMPQLTPAQFAAQKLGGVAPPTGASPLSPPSQTSTPSPTSAPLSQASEPSLPPSQAQLLAPSTSQAQPSAVPQTGTQVLNQPVSGKADDEAPTKVASADTGTKTDAGGGTKKTTKPEPEEDPQYKALLGGVPFTHPHPEQLQRKPAEYQDPNFWERVRQNPNAFTAEEYTKLKEDYRHRNEPITIPYGDGNFSYNPYNPKAPGTFTGTRKEKEFDMPGGYKDKRGYVLDPQGGYHFQKGEIKDFPTTEAEAGELQATREANTEQDKESAKAAGHVYEVVQGAAQMGNRVETLARDIRAVVSQKGWSSGGLAGARRFIARLYATVNNGAQIDENEIDESVAKDVVTQGRGLLKQAMQEGLKTGGDIMGVNARLFATELPTIEEIIGDEGKTGKSFVATLNNLERMGAHLNDNAEKIEEWRLKQPNGRPTIGIHNELRKLEKDFHIMRPEEVPAIASGQTVTPGQPIPPPKPAKTEPPPPSAQKRPPPATAAPANIHTLPSNATDDQKAAYEKLKKLNPDKYK